MHKQYCSICRCKVSNTSLRKVPKCDEKRQLWSESAGVTFTETNCICDKHFEEKDFYYTAEKKRRRLLPDAIPKGLQPESEDDEADSCSKEEKERLAAGIALENLRMKRQIVDLEHANRRLIQKTKDYEQLNKSMRKIFTASQVRQMTNGGKKVFWSSEDIYYGISLHAAGPNAYRSLVKKGFPFPCERTLRRWSSLLKKKKQKVQK